MWVKWRDSAVILETKKREGIPLVLIVFLFYVHVRNLQAIVDQ